MFLVVCFFAKRFLLNKSLTFKSGYFSNVDVSTVVPFSTLKVYQQASRYIYSLVVSHNALLNFRDL